MLYAFGDFRLDTDRRELHGAGRVCPIEPKAFSVLVYLLTHRDRAVSKEECLQACWPGEFVTEAALNRCLRVIRQAVDDDGVRQHVIRTIRGYGFRFVAAVAVRDSVITMAHAPATARPLHERSASVRETALPNLPPPAAAPAGPSLPPPAATLPCPSCQSANRATRQFCAMCGHELWRPCPHCGFENSPRERFCGGCGQDVTTIVPIATGTRIGPPLAYTPSHLATKILTGRQSMVGERKPVTVLTAGIDGLEALLQVGAPEEMDEVLNRGFAMVVAEIYSVEGFVTQVTRDGLTALFGAPLACEDHALRALYAALGVQRVFAAYAAELQRTYSVLLPCGSGYIQDRSWSAL